MYKKRFQNSKKIEHSCLVDHKISLGIEKLWLEITNLKSLKFKYNQCHQLVNQETIPKTNQTESVKEHP